MGICPIRKELEQIKPMKAVFDPNYVSRISGPNVKKGSSKMDLAQQLMTDIQHFKKPTNATRGDRVVWVHREISDSSCRAPKLGGLERGLQENSPTFRQPDLRLRRHEVWHPLCQWRA